MCGIFVVASCLTVCSCHVTYATLAKWFASSAKWLSVRLRTKWFWVRVQLHSLCFMLFEIYICVLGENEFQSNYKPIKKINAHGENS